MEARCPYRARQARIGPDEKGDAAPLAQNPQSRRHSTPVGSPKMSIHEGNARRRAGACADRISVAIGIIEPHQPRRLAAAIETARQTR
jgi:hypothetical protein